jgi:hypothetical protein
MTSLPVDAVTIGCTTLTLLGGYATFVSSKPVSLASILMIIVLSASTTQAIIGFLRGWEKPGPEPELDASRSHRDADVLDMLSTLVSYARFGAR